MIETSKRLSVRILAALALALPACNLDAAGQIPCVEDVSCPNDYPVCGPAGKCIAGNSTAGASVAIVGADGHAAADFLSGTVRVLVSARAATGVKTVALASGSTNFTASATAATAPLYAFDVNTTALTDGDAPLTATLTAGDGTTGTASGTLHVDNAKPTIVAFTVGGGTSATVTSGKTIGIAATFSGGTATISSSAGGSVSVTSGASVLVGPDVASTFKLRVTSRSGVIVDSGSAGQPPDVTVNVVAPVSFTSSFSVSPSSIAQGDTGTFTFTAPSFSASVVTATINDGTNPPVAITSGGTVQIPYPATSPGTTALTYTLLLKNGATAPDTISLPLVVTVNQGLPTITSFVFQASGTNAATFNPGDDVVLAHVYDAKGGTARINAVITAGLSGATTTVTNLQSSTVYRLTVTNPDGVSVFADVTATVNARINAFTVGATQPASSSSAVISSGASTKLFASFAGSGVSGNAPAALACAPACAATLGAATIANGGNVTVTGSTNGTLTYTLTATSSAGTPTTGAVTVKVVPLATATSLTADSNLIRQGGFATLTPVFSFGTSPAVTGTAVIVGTDGSTYAGLASGVGVVVTPVGTTVTYTLQVANGAGTAASATPSTVITVAPGTWSALNDATAETRRGATVTALDDGRVLIAGGADGTDLPRDTARVCDATGACASKTMNSKRAFHTAVKIGSGSNKGKVFLAGGYTATGLASPTDTVEFFDPTSNSFTSLTHNLTSPRARHVGVLLADGTTVLIAGGTSGATNLKTAMKYDGSVADPAVVATVTNMHFARADFTGTLLASSKVLLVGGTGGGVVISELFDPADATTAFKDTAGTALPANEDKVSHTAVLIDSLVNLTGKVLISGGTTTAAGGKASGTQFLYDPGTDAFTSIGSLSTARTRHGASAFTLLSSRKILVCGGVDVNNATLRSCELFDPETGANGTLSPTAPMFEPRADFGLAPITISSIFEVLAAGGLTSPMQFAETYNPL